MSPKPLAKSLHTITALQRVAVHLLDNGMALNQHDAVQAALAVLGYHGAPDPYGLAAKAVEALTRALPKAKAPADPVQEALDNLEARGLVERI